MKNVFLSFYCNNFLSFYLNIVCEFGLKHTYFVNACTAYSNIHIEINWLGALFLEIRIPGVNFINVLWAAFTCAYPKSIRIQSNPQYLFVLLGSTCSKAAHRTLMKSTPWLNFINILRTVFMLADPESVKRYWWLNCIFFGIYELKSCSKNVDEIDILSRYTWSCLPCVHL